MTRTSIIVAIALTNLTGCVDGDIPDDELSSAEQEVDSTQLTSLRTCTNPTSAQQECWFELAPDNGTRACFLAGIKGNVQGGIGIAGGAASIEKKDGKFFLFVAAPGGTGRSLSASAVCITPYNAIFKASSQWTGGAATDLGNTPGMQCFLRGFRNFGGFTHSADQISVFQQADGTWFIGGNQPGGSVRAGATCIVPTGGSVWGYGYAWNNGTNTLPLAPNTGGVACALTKIQGAFTTDTDRVSVGYNPGLLEWNMTLSGASHAGGARCFD